MQVTVGRIHFEILAAVNTLERDFFAMVEQSQAGADQPGIPMVTPENGPGLLRMLAQSTLNQQGIRGYGG